MSPEFSAAVDPLILHILNVISKAEAGQLSDPAAVSRIIRDRMHHAENQLGRRDDWELAQYALASFTDAMLIETNWSGRAWWTNNLLEFELFQTGEAFTEFFQKADDANRLPRKDALEVFYLCVVLGFRGIYGAPDEKPFEHNLPGSLAEWSQRTAESIRHGQGRLQLSNQTRPIAGAGPLEGKYLLIGAVLFFVMLLAIASIMFLRIRQSL